MDRVGVKKKVGINRRIWDTISELHVYELKGVFEVKGMSRMMAASTWFTTAGPGPEDDRLFIPDFQPQHLEKLI